MSFDESPIPWNDLATQDKLSEIARERRNSIADWPRESLRLCAASGLFTGLVGDRAWPDRDGIAAYVRLAALDVVTAFVVTQYMAAAKRIFVSDNLKVREFWLPKLLAGDCFATVGISHLTTSRQHLASPILKAIRNSFGWELRGTSPWVTGAAHAKVLVIGATTEDQREILVAVPADRAGIVSHPGVELLGLTASCTGQVEFNGVQVNDIEVLAGPVNNVLSTGTQSGTGGLQTSALAIGLAHAACQFLRKESLTRVDLKPAADELHHAVEALEGSLYDCAAGTSSCTTHELRAQANMLVLRCTQAALATAKGAGYVVGHPVGRWCQEALFFLVWSCPTPVAHQQLCELARIL